MPAALPASLRRRRPNAASGLVRRPLAVRRATAVVAVVGCLVAAGCGSQIDPNTASRASGGGGTVAGTDAGTDPGLVGGDTTLADGGLVPVDPGAPAGGDVAGSGTAGGSAPDAGGGAPAAGGTGGTSAGGSGSTGGSGSAGGTKATKAPAAGTKAAASCDGFNNSQPGITADTIKIANSSDISGPVPGLFTSAQQATKAFVAYFNATSSICGHKLALDPLDSRTDSAADQQSYAAACQNDFAAVGSQSAFDAGGAATAQSCGLPDIRSFSVSADRTNCTTCYAAYGVRPNQVPDAMPKYWLQAEPEATQHVGMLYINAGAAPENATNFRDAWVKNGWKVDVFQSINVSDFDYTSYVQQLKKAGVQFVNYTGPYQGTVKLQQAMRGQGFVPKVFLQDATIYDKGYTESAGDLAEGSYVYSQVHLLDDLANPEVKLYRTWLQQAAPGAAPNIYGAYAWSAARLFAQQAIALGGKLTRASLVASMAGVKDWTDSGLHVPQNVGGKVTANCVQIIQYSGGAWKQVSSGEYLCGGITSN